MSAVEEYLGQQERPADVKSEDLMHGPCMSQLTEKRRAFVWAMMSKPFESATDWARAAGYKDAGNGGIRVRAQEALLDPKVQAAVQEVARATLGSEGPIVAMRGLIEIAKNKDHKDHAKAIEMILNRTGSSEKQQIEVVHRDLTGDALLERIRYLAEKHHVALSDDLTIAKTWPPAIEHQPAKLGETSVDEPKE